MTDHGAFVIFNVYVPTNGAAGAKLPFKLRFLDALTARMKVVRAKGKGVILAGMDRN